MALAKQKLPLLTRPRGCVTGASKRVWASARRRSRLMRAGLGAEAADLRDDFLALEEALGERAGEAAAEEESCESLTLTLTPMGPLEAKAVAAEGLGP